VKAAVSGAAVLLLLLAAVRAGAACNVTATGVNFGAYDVFSSVPLDSTGSVSVSCDEVPPPDPVVMIGTSGTSGGYYPRMMRRSSGSGTLEYNLFTDSSMTAVWGDGTAGTSIVQLKNIKRQKPPVETTIYGRIPAGQNVASGAYADTLTVTITW
jgi:spore coat protein U-like protein